MKTLKYLDLTTGKPSQLTGKSFLRDSLAEDGINFIDEDGFSNPSVKRESGFTGVGVEGSVSLLENTPSEDWEVVEVLGEEVSLHKNLKIGKYKTRIFFQKEESCLKSFIRHCQLTKEAATLFFDNDLAITKDGVISRHQRYGVWHYSKSVFSTNPELEVAESHQARLVAKAALMTHHTAESMKLNTWYATTPHVRFIEKDGDRYAQIKNGWAAKVLPSRHKNASGGTKIKCQYSVREYHRAYTAEAWFDRAVSEYELKDSQAVSTENESRSGVWGADWNA